MKRILLLPACLILLLTACRQQEPVNQLKEINSALERANLIIEDNNHFAYEEMDAKLKDPRTHDGATIWEPRARIIRQRALESKMLIASLKNALIKQSDSLQNQDRAIVTRILKADGNAGKLFENLILLKDSAINVFEKVEELNRDSGFFSKKVLQIDVTAYSKADWLNKNFDKCSPLLAVMALNKIEANVINTESICINHCNAKVMYNFCGYYSPGPLASINSNIVRSGDTISITAGVGVFAKEMSPRITINGTRIKLYDSPIAEYEFIAIGKPGTYSVPVIIEYMDSDGSWQTAFKKLGYIITDNK